MSKRIDLGKPFDLGSIDGNGEDISFVASDEQCKEILTTLGIVDLSDVKGDARIRPWHKTGFMIEGRIEATAVQECVVTLEPVPEQINEDFQRTFIGEAEASKLVPDADVEPEFMLEAEDPPDVLTGHTIDLLAIVAEHIALGLDPWPRQPGAEIDPAYSEGKAAEDEEGPFAALKRLKDK